MTPSLQAFPMRRKSLRALWLHGFHRMDYSEWGDPNNPRVLVCVHGLTRNSRDFDALADALCDSYRVICPDVAGRGTSEWLGHATDYGYPLYLSDMAALIARTGAATVDWVGTSMGGLIGMMLASQSGTPIQKLVMNDVGSIVTAASLQRLATYVGQPAVFDSMDQANAYFRRVYGTFGPLTDAQWHHIAAHGVHQGVDGKYRPTYDPAIAGGFGAVPMADVDLSLVWNAVSCPTLVLRGQHSDLLLPQTVARMKLGHPQLQTVEIPHCGHAPALMDPSQIRLVRDFLIA